jgi:hypothetical protein
LSDPLNIDDFAPLSPLVRGYEFRSSCAYLILCNGAEFSASAAYALMRDIRQMHPAIEIAIVATPKVKSIEVREKELPQQSDGMPTSDQEQESKQSREE